MIINLLMRICCGYYNIAACALGYEKVASVLVDNGAILDSKDADGRSALAFATANRMY